MSNLPDELWRRILEMGVESSKLNFKDISCISITCRRLNRLSAEDTLWSSLLYSDFKSSTGISSNYKSQYRIRYERDKEQKLLAHRRVVWRIESEIAERSRKIREIELHYAQEREKIRKTLAELSNLHKVRQASVALNVWQPELVRSRQNQIVEQSDVPAESRISALEMELRLCKIQITDYDKALKLEKAKLQAAQEKLTSVKYHPLNDFNQTEYRNDEHKRRKKMKH